MEEVTLGRTMTLSLWRWFVECTIASDENNFSALPCIVIHVIICEFCGNIRFLSVRHEFDELCAGVPARGKCNDQQHDNGDPKKCQDEFRV